MPHTTTQQIRDEMHSIDRDIWNLEDLLREDDDEYEPVTLALSHKRRRRPLSPRSELRESTKTTTDPFWADQAHWMIRATLNVLFAKRKTLYRKLRAEYRRNSGMRRGKPVPSDRTI
jgi:hypothetical protein